jgi:hypothetical protein
MHFLDRSSDVGAFLGRRTAFIPFLSASSERTPPFDPAQGSFSPYLGIRPDSSGGKRAFSGVPKNLQASS